MGLSVHINCVVCFVAFLVFCLFFILLVLVSFGSVCVFLVVVFADMFFGVCCLG